MDFPILEDVFPARRSWEKVSRTRQYIRRVDPAIAEVGGWEQDEERECLHGEQRLCCRVDFRSRRPGSPIHLSMINEGAQIEYKEVRTLEKPDIYLIA